MKQHDPFLAVLLVSLVHILCQFSQEVVAVMDYHDKDWSQYSSEELERQVSPSRWNPDKSPNAVIKEYVDVSLQDTNIARKQLAHTLDITYGPLPAQKYDLYGTDWDAGTSNIFVWIHGGYWQEGSKDISGGIALLNHRRGWRTIVLGYTLAPNAKIADIEQELLTALTQIMTEYPNVKLVIGGHSAGGQMAAYLLHSPAAASILESGRVVGLVLVSGVFDLRMLVTTYVNQPLRMDESEAQSLSPLLLQFTQTASVLKHHLHIFVMVGGYDSPEFQQQSISYKTRLESANVRFTVSYMKSEYDDHFTIVQNMARESSLVANATSKFLDECVSRVRT